MAIQTVSISLRAYKTGAIIKNSDFLDPLNISETDKILYKKEGENTGQSSYIEFFNSGTDDFSGESEPDEALHSAIRDTFEYIAGWIEQRDENVWQNFRAAEIMVEIFIDMWINQNQVEMKFSPKFLAACSKNGIGIEFISND